MNISYEQSTIETQLGYAFRALWRAQNAADALGLLGLSEDLGGMVALIGGIQGELLAQHPGRKLRKPSAVDAESRSGAIARSRSRRRRAEAYARSKQRGSAPGDSGCRS